MKKLFFAFLVGAAAVSSQAAYLYWQVDSGSTGDFSGDYNAARVGYYDISDVGGYADTAAMEAAGKVTYDTNGYATPDGSMTSRAEFDVSAFSSNPSGYAFFIELVNYSDGNMTHVAYSESMSYAQLVEHSYIDTGLTPMLPVAWHGSNYNAVPEPTSALMLVLGFAFLGLKRRTA